MRVLGIDTSLTAVSACIFDSFSSSIVSSDSILLARGHAEALPPLLDRVISRMEGDFSSIDKIAVTVGPGSFTGIRVGVASARAIALALDVPVVGVSTLSAFAAPLVMEGGNFTIVSAIDARHGNVYFQTFGTDGRTIQGPRLSKVSEAASMLRKGPFRIAGSAGAALTLEVRLLSLSADPAGELQNPLIEFVARLGANADSARAPALPLYLKAAEAASQMLLKLDQG